MLEQVLSDIADLMVEIDSSRVPFRHFQPGVGPYGEPQLVKSFANMLNKLPRYQNKVRTKRTPDLIIRGEWALEFKITRPFGDNGNEAENWSVNLLHPYGGNVSTIGDCLKLVDLSFKERKAAVVIGYEHDPPKIELSPLIKSFEAIARQIIKLRLGERIEINRKNLIHPIHQQFTIYAWEVLGITI